jgi:hypothetical protein
VFHSERVHFVTQVKDAPSVLCHPSSNHGGESMTSEVAAKLNGRPQVLCPTCRAFASRIVYSVLNSKTGKNIRVFRCECGEHVWDD